MREIKFRIWHGGNMYYMDKGNHLTLSFFSEGIPWGLYESATEARLVTGDPNAILNEPGILMQFTGLKDKSGIEIYEGDVVKKEDPTYWVSSIGPEGPEPPDDEDIKVWRGGTGKVVATDFGYAIENINCGDWCFNGPEGREWANFEIEVIGNIHKNPELIEREAKI